MASKHIHKGKCGPCYLCHKSSARYTHPLKMDKAVVKLILDIEESTISDTACICHACSKQAARNVNNPNYQPRWRPKPITIQYCGILNCSEKVYRHTSITTPSFIENILGEKLTAFSVAHTTNTPLCQKHYMRVYTALQKHPNCECCGLKCSEQYPRHCPLPDLINPYLSEVTNEPSTLTKSSIVCNSCYQFFTRTINQIHQNPNTTTSDIIGMSTVEANLSKKINDIKSRDGEITIAEYTELTFCLSAQKLAKSMVKNEATLLPVIYRAFCESAMETISLYPYLHITSADLPCRRWFASRLNHYFLENIVFECKHCHIGTMVFYRNCDLLTALSLALGKQKSTHDKVVSNEPESEQEVPSIEEKVATVAAHLNTKLHEQAKVFVEEFKTPDKYSNMDISVLINDTDPVLLNFIKQLTRTVRDTKRKLFPEVDPNEEPNVKTIRQFYALCVLLFSTNSTCSAPLHVMLSEAILCNGGNLELVKIMNRIGAAACLDTCNRLATKVVKIRMKEGVKKCLVPGKLAIASIDNIDILQPHAIVSSLDATRSWHGTSVQCMQPLPVTGALSDSEMVSPHTTSTPIYSSPILVQRHKRRRRTLTEQPSPHTTSVTRPHPPVVPENIVYEYSPARPTIKDFLLTEDEKTSLAQLQLDIYQAMQLKHFSDKDTIHLPSIPSLIHCTRKQCQEAEVSNVVYADILSEKADCKATLLKVVGKLYQTFICDLNQKWVIVVGDAKVYDLLQTLRVEEYSESMKWLIPMPGDWHVLYNYQKAAMKPYIDAGLATLAAAAGYRAETLTSIRNATNFRRTHLFILQCYEAFYSYFLQLFYSSKSECDEGVYEENIKLAVQNLLDKFQTITSDSDLEHFRASVISTFTNQQLTDMHDEFMAYMKALSLKQDTVKFWYNFLFEDCAAYISLYASIRYRIWDLRTASLKQLVAVYTAFDRPTYQQLIPRHLHDLALMPDYIKQHFRNGGFSIRLSSSEWCGVALDECHEMCINKDSKLAVIRPSEDKMCHISNYLPFRSKCMNNLKTQLFPERKGRKRKGCYVPSSRDKVSQANTTIMVKTLQTHGMYIDLNDNQGLFNIEKKKATPEQAHDLLNFRTLGQEAFEHNVKYRLLRDPSTKAPLRKKRLQTFSTSKVQKQKIKLVEKERKLSQCFLKRQLAWMAENDISPKHTDGLFGSISSLPRALIGKDGLPFKSAKSNTTHYLEKRYKSSPIIQTSLPWIPTSAILEGMFLIQTSPLTTTENMMQYAKLLFRNYIMKHLNAGALEVHIIFDNPGGLSETPKELEQRRRDTSTTASDHHCCKINSNTLVSPSTWRTLLACRKCKGGITSYLAEEFLRIAPGFLAENSSQEVLTNVKGTVYSINKQQERLERPSYNTCMDEADTRIWLHCIHCAGRKVLIYSPDTDVYHIGLGLMHTMPDTDIIIQLSKSLSEAPRLLNLKALVEALRNDPDLSGIPSELRPQTIQSLYACTGCDYISFFAGIGKSRFLSTFFQYAQFIAGGLEPPGSLGVVSTNCTDDFLSFLRLVGCAYFRLHTSAFIQPSPVVLYHSVSNTDTFQAHAEWLELIRRAVWLRADKESQNLPTLEALRLHWRRCLWVLAMWHSSTQNEVELPALTEYGWQRIDGKLEVLWDSPENVASAHQRVQYVLNGCRCKTGCSTRRCKCLKENRKCGPGCRCTGCMNTVIQMPSVGNELDELEAEDATHQPDDDAGSVTDESDDACNSQDELDNEVDTLMDYIFGDSESDSESESEIEEEFLTED